MASREKCPHLTGIITDEDAVSAFVTIPLITGGQSMIIYSYFSAAPLMAFLSTTLFSAILVNLTCSLIPSLIVSGVSQVTSPMRRTGRHLSEGSSAQQLQAMPQD